MNYIYNALVTSVYDGDTITVDIDLGFNTILTNQKIRLYGIDTPELRGDEREFGLAVRDYVRTIILDQRIVLRTIRDKKGKYGRWLGIIQLGSSSLNHKLLTKGFATEYYP